MKNIKDLKPTFKFVGDFKEIKELVNKDGIPYGKELVIYDKVMESEVGIRIFNSNEAKYWDTLKTKMVTVNSDIKNTMNNIKSNGVGIPLSFTVIGNSTLELYTNNDFIDCVSKLKKGSKIKVEGSVLFKTYKGRVQRDYTVRKLYVLPTNHSEDVGLYMTLPMVFSKDSRESFKVFDYKHIVSVLVKSKLEGTGYGYRAINLAMDKKYMLNGLVGDVACDQINSILDKTFSELQGDFDYAIANVMGRLKTGEITRKPTEEDLNPMELAILKLKGQDMLKDRLNSMEEISTYFDDLVFNIIDFSAGKFSEKINKSDLNLISENESPTVASNPMLEALNAFKISDAVSEENKVEKKETVIENNTSLEDLVAQTEKSNNFESTVSDNFEEDFPF